MHRASRARRHKYIASTCVMLSHASRREPLRRGRGTVITIRNLTWKVVLSVDEWPGERVDENASDS